MKFTRLVMFSVIMGAFGAGGLQAQSFRSQPSEFPPSSYKGKQFVDSKGCVYIRAGIDGNVAWVPRVSRKRQGVCGFKPTNVGTASATLSGGTGSPVQITLNNGPAQVATRPVAPQPIPQKTLAPRVVRQTAQAPVVRKAAPRPVAVAPVIVQAPAALAPTANVCPGRSALSQQYSGSATSGLAVRCGPQSAKIVTSGASYRPAGVGAALAPVGALSTTRIVPKHVAQNRINTYANVSVPSGYKPVWEDDRLNPNRAEQNLAGRSQMLLIWTNTVPRRLVNQANGRDMTAKLPLVYPYTSFEQQRRELGEVTFANRDGQLVKRIKRNPGVAPVMRKPVYSSRSAPKPSAPTAAPVRAAGDTYIQIGTFRDSANAQKSAQRIAALGMGARIGKSTRGGKTYLSVQAGPFVSAAAPKVLGKLRGLGYRDAFIR